MAFSKLNMKGVIEDFAKKFPKASFNEKDLEFHMGTFAIMEKHLNIPRIGARAVTTHIEPDGSFEMNEGLFTFHWICFRGVNASLDVYYVHHRPNPMLIRKREHILTEWNRYELTKRDWQVCQDEIDTFKIPRKYFEADPDEDPLFEQELWLAKKVKDTICKARQDPDGVRNLKKRATCYIEQQYEELLEEYQDTHNNYHLARADFYRKLKVGQMRLEHIVLCAIAYEGKIEPYLIEKKLRTSYSEKIDSL